MQPSNVPEVQEGHLERMRQPRHRRAERLPGRAAVQLSMIEQVSASELHTLMPVPLIDVREKNEYDAGHVPGAAWIPMSLVPLRIEEFRTTQPTYVICRTGNRSGQVVMWLASRGIRAINVDGGTQAWQAAGLPVNTLTRSA